MKSFFILFILLLLFSTSSVLAGYVTIGSGSSANIVVDSNTGTNIKIGYVPYCGNNFIDGGEQCDESKLNGATCISKGYDGGTLSCSSSCVYNFDGCYKNSDNGGNGGSGGGSSGGSSGGSGSSCNKNWNCTEWSSCNGGIQTRTCTTGCGLISTKPETSRTCTVEGANGDAGIGLGDQDSTRGGFFAGITGAVIGGGAGSWIAAILFVLIIAGFLIWILLAKKKKKPTSGDVKVKKK